MLKPGTTWDDVKKTCDEAKQHKFAAVCIPACFVKEAKSYLEKSDVKVATVVGFPFGYTSTNAKVAETASAIKDGVDEIDMVINIGYLKSKWHYAILDEIRQIK